MSKNDLLQTATNLLLRDISHLQRTDGCFESSSSSDFMMRSGKPNVSVFSNALLLENLAQMGVIGDVVSKLSTWLFAQQDVTGAFNYWPRNSVETLKFPYPNDLDDTAIALSALHMVGGGFFTGDMLANFVRLLCNQEVVEGGPYKTWVVDVSQEEVWSNTDTIVNANICYFLKKLGVELPELTRYIECQILSGHCLSGFYVSNPLQLYFLSRVDLNSNCIDALKSVVLDELDIAVEKRVLSEISLCLLALQNLNSLADSYGEYFEYMLQEVCKSKELIYPLWFDPSVGGIKFYSGSEALSKSFILKALLINSDTAFASVPPALVALEKHLLGVGLPVSFILEVLVFVREYFNIRTLDFIYKLPTEYAQNLSCNSVAMSHEMLNVLGVANVLGWIGYTVQDDLLDGDTQIPTNSIYLAECFLREMYCIYQKLLGHNISYISEITSDIDVASFTQSTRVEKSYGFLLAPTAILLLSGYEHTNKIYSWTKSFFNSYITIKQLYDDIEDWEIDYKNKIQTSITEILDPDTKTFWEDSAPQLIDLLQNELNINRSLILDCPSVFNTKFCANLMAPFEKGIEGIRLKRDFVLNLQTLPKNPIMA